MSIHHAQLWVYLTRTAKSNIDSKSFTSTNRRAIMGFDWCYMDKYHFYKWITNLLPLLYCVSATYNKGLHLESIDWGFAFGISSEAMWIRKMWLLLLFALCKWKTMLIISYNVWLLVIFEVTYLKFGKFCHVVIWCQDIGCFVEKMGLSHNWGTRTKERNWK